MSFDASKIAMDYHSIGFRECAAEVARYLVPVEGLDLQDPLRLRLMSHLQCFAAQRELASKPPPPTPPTHWPSPYGVHDTSGSSGTSANSSFESNTTTGSSACDTSHASTPPTLTPLAPATPSSYPHGYHPNHQVPHQPPSYHHQDYSPQKPYRPWGGTELAY